MQIILDITKLNLGERQVLGDRKNIDDAVLYARNDAKKDDSAKQIAPCEAINISSGSEGSIPPPFLTPKAHKLIKLTRRASEATDNLVLSAIVLEFVAVLKSNSSRNLTKEGFGFLDALYKQLANPSVFVVPLRCVLTTTIYGHRPRIIMLMITCRTSRTRSDKEQVPEKEPTNVKLGVVARLRREVGSASGSEALATMVADFGRVTNKSSGRTVTKVRLCVLCYYTT